MIYRIKENKGSSLPVVFISVAVLIVLVSILAESVGQWYKSQRSNETEEYTYVAADSAIERCFYNLDKVITVPGFTSGITWTSDEAFASKVLEKINLKTAASPSDVEFIDNDYTAGDGIQVLESDTAAKADIKITIGRGEGVLTRTAGNSKLMIPVSLTAKASLGNGAFFSSGRTVYAQKNFEVYIPNEFRLNGAIYSLGDFFAINGVTADITGDVYTFGTSPKKKNEPNQNYYGGIYAKDESLALEGTKLTINGNAYSRSFIRAGKSKGITDKSKIKITKDAIAQGIHIFGNKNKIVVYNNAYTFDDLQIDGEDSVIAVNGSYIGLSNGDELHHDASSAIVNAAPIHPPNINSPDSLKSRIVINGDVLINGGTFKINEISNTCEFQIEDASLAWHVTPAGDKNPAYRDTAVANTAEYITYLKNISDVSDGFSNIIQKWTKFVPTGIDGWLTQIDNVRGVGQNNFANITSNAAAASTELTGYCNFAIAANNELYFMNKDDIDGDFSDLKQITHLNDGSFALDNTTAPEVPSVTPTDTEIEKWKKYWDDIAGVSDVDWPHTYCDTKIPDMFKELRNKLFNITDVFADRSYPPKDDDDSIEETDITNSYVGAPAKVNGVDPENKFMYLADYLDYVFTDGNNPKDTCVLKFVDAPGSPFTTDLIGYLDSKGVESVDYDTEHFLIINLDPENTIKVKESQIGGDDKSDFKGIIFSLGRVEVDKGMTINGAIIAAGRGMDPADSTTGTLDGSAAMKKEVAPGDKRPRLPQILTDGSNQGVFENGGYAGIIIGKSGDGGATIYFPGRTNLLNSFYSQTKSIDLYSIF